MAETPLTGLTASVKIEGVVLGYCSGVDLTLEKRHDRNFIICHSL